MIRTVGAASLVLFGLANPAMATSSLLCESADGAAVNLIIGHVAVSAISGGWVAHGDTRWVIGDDIIVGQQFADKDKLIADFTDPNIENIVASLRLFNAVEGDVIVTAGSLLIKGTGAFAIVCEEI